MNHQRKVAFVMSFKISILTLVGKEVTKKDTFHL